MSIDERLMRGQTARVKRSQLSVMGDLNHVDLAWGHVM
jgi:hypothetical protein